MNEKKRFLKETTDVMKLQTEDVLWSQQKMFKLREFIPRVLGAPLIPLALRNNTNNVDLSVARIVFSTIL